MNVELVAGSPSSFPQVPPAAAPRLVDGMVLRHLQTPAQVASVLHLREEIDLSVHAAAGRAFVDLEKKETSAAWCSGSSSPARR